MNASPYPTLFSPMRLGPKVARNRTWMSAHATLLVKDHVFTDEHVAYYAERAKHGVAVITMECMAVHETSLPYRGKALSFDPRMVPQYRKIAAAVQEHGSLLLAQPWHDDWLWTVAARMVKASGLSCGPEGHGAAAVRV